MFSSYEVSFYLTLLVAGTIFKMAPIPIENEYEKNPEIKPEDIEIFRRWICSQPHLPFEKITDLDLILAYHCCERSSEVSKQVLDLNFTLKTMFSFFQNREINKSLELAFKTCAMLPLEGLTHKGNRVLYFHILDSDPKNFVYVDMVRQFTMVMDLWQYLEGTFPGLALIIDMQNFSMGHVSRIDLGVAQQIFYYLQEALFVKLKEFHFINAPSFMDKVLLIYKPFMKKQLLEMLQIHQKGSDTLDKVIAKSVLPKESGGLHTDCHILRDELWEKVKANQQFFIDESKKRVDESKRPGSPKSITSIFGGVEGTFKKLDID